MIYNYYFNFNVKSLCIQNLMPPKSMVELFYILLMYWLLFFSTNILRIQYRSDL